MIAGLGGDPDWKLAAVRLEGDLNGARRFASTPAHRVRQPPPGCSRRYGEVSERASLVGHGVAVAKVEHAFILIERLSPKVWYLVHEA
jgi:hypothetical protein